MREIELHHLYDDLQAVPNAPYRVVFEDGTLLQGSLDGNGYKLLRGVPAMRYCVEFGEDPRDWHPAPLTPEEAEYAKPEVQAEGRRLLEALTGEDAGDGAVDVEEGGEPV